MRILIIGGTGLISTPITRMLVERGDQVTLFNRGKSESRFGAETEATVQTIVGDRRDTAAFVAQMRAVEPFDCVVEMIGYSVPDAESLVQAFAHRCGQLIFCSTVNVYATPADSYPIRETEQHRPTAWEYAVNKVKIEAILQEAEARGDFPLTVLRPGHTYGEGSGLIYSLGGGTKYLDRIRRNKPIVVHGDGSSLWSPCHKDDVARGFAAAIGNPAVYGKSYHLTGEEWLTWNRYHEIVAEAMDAPPPHLVHIPTDLLARMVPERGYISRINFQYNNIFDNTLARRDLGFRYTVPFLDGVRRLVGWLDARGKIENSDADPLDDAIVAAWERYTVRLVEELASYR